MTIAPGLPPAFIERLRRILPIERLEPCLRSFAEPRDAAFRVNTLRAGVEVVRDALAAEGIATHPIVWMADAFTVASAQREALTRSRVVLEGWIYVQNPSSLLPPILLDPQPGEEVLDLAAAPGGKTLQMACQMQDRGRIAAVESVRSRFFRLRANLATHGATCVQSYLADGTRTWHKTPERFDRVLLDAPCSSEARMRPDTPATFRHWSKRKILEMARKQRRLLYSAIQCLRPGGRLVYSTCSFAPEENEAVIDWALETFPNTLSVGPIGLPFENLQEGITEWDGTPLSASVRLARRVLPQAAMEGFFVCVLEKLQSTCPTRGGVEGRRGRTAAPHDGRRRARARDRAPRVTARAAGSDETSYPRARKTTSRRRER